MQTAFGANAHLFLLEEKMKGFEETVATLKCIQEGKRFLKLWRRDSEDYRKNSFWLKQILLEGTRPSEAQELCCLLNAYIQDVMERLSKPFKPTNNFLFSRCVEIQQ